jgi:hypothetical protein
MLLVQAKIHRSPIRAAHHRFGAAVGSSGWLAKNCDDASDASTARAVGPMIALGKY